MAVDLIGAAQTTPVPNPLAAPLQPGGSMGKQEFLQLLVAQLKHQDPLNPSDAQEFAAQLAQFSSVEQLVKIGEQLEAQSQLNQTMIQMLNVGSALNLLGKDIVAEGNRLVIPDSGDVSVSVKVGGSGGNGVLKIYDQDGVFVAEQKLGSLGAGDQDIDVSQWVGKLDAGEYTYEIEVTDAKGVSVPVTKYMTGPVEGVQYTANGPVLVSGPVTIPLSAVVEIKTKHEAKGESL